jgi:hypothetical protein
VECFGVRTEGGEKQNRGTAAPFYGGPVAWQRERGRGSEVEGGSGGELRPRGTGRCWWGVGSGAGSRRTGVAEAASGR